MNLAKRLELLEKRQGRGFQKIAAKIIRARAVTDYGLSVFDQTWERCPDESDIALKQRATEDVLKLPGRTLTRMVMGEVARAMEEKCYGKIVEVKR